jgi:translation elongation factor EF-Tu-like GTPase
MFRKLLDEAVQETTSVLCFEAFRETEIERGQVLQSRVRCHLPQEVQGPGIRTEKDEGGRHTPFFNNTDRSSISEQRT